MRGYVVLNGEVAESEFVDSKDVYEHYTVLKSAKRCHVGTNVPYSSCFVVKDCAVHKAIYQLEYIVRMCKAEEQLSLSSHPYTLLEYNPASLKEALENLRIAKELGPILHTL